LRLPGGSVEYTANRIGRHIENLLSNRIPRTKVTSNSLPSSRFPADRAQSWRQAPTKYELPVRHLFDGFFDLPTDEVEAKAMDTAQALLAIVVKFA
jgi:hypothetical protein